VGGEQLLSPTDVANKRSIVVVSDNKKLCSELKLRIVRASAERWPGRSADAVSVGTIAAGEDPVAPEPTGETAKRANIFESFGDIAQVQKGAESTRELYEVVQKLADDGGNYFPTSAPGSADAAEALSQSSQRGGLRTNKWAMSNNVLLRVNDSRRGLASAVAVVVPTELKRAIMYVYHDHTGHGGRDVTRRKIEKNYWWGTMARDIKKYVKECPSCLSARGRITKKGTFAGYSRPGAAPFSTVHMDIHGPWVKSRHGNTYVLIMICASTGYVEVAYLPAADASTVAFALATHIFARYGEPDKIVTDNGSENKNKLLQDVVATLANVHHKYTAVGRPQQNSLAENVHVRLGHAVRTCNRRRSGNGWFWDADYNVGVQHVNSSPLEQGRPSAAELVLGYIPTLKFEKDTQRQMMGTSCEDVATILGVDPELLKAELEDDLAIRGEMNEIRTDQTNAGRKPQQFLKGDYVMRVAPPASSAEGGITSKLEPRTKGPYVVTHARHGGSLTIHQLRKSKENGYEALEGGSTVETTADFLTPYFPDDDRQKSEREFRDLMKRQPAPPDGALERAAKALNAVSGSKASYVLTVIKSVDNNEQQQQELLVARIWAARVNELGNRVTIDVQPCATLTVTPELQLKQFRAQRVLRGGDDDCFWYSKGGRQSLVVRPVYRHHITGALCAPEAKHPTLNIMTRELITLDADVIVAGPFKLITNKSQAVKQLRAEHRLRGGDARVYETLPNSAWAAAARSTTIVSEEIRARLAANASLPPVGQPLSKQAYSKCYDDELEQRRLCPLEADALS